jgi:Ca2+-binding EF-hand superfamily protein
MKTATAALFLLACAVALPLAPAAAPVPKKPADPGQDFVFLAEARPVLVRVHVRIDGKPLAHAWHECLASLFAYLDVNGDGVLSKQEAEAAPNLTQFRNGPFAPNGGGPGPTMAELDADKDGKVTFHELSEYYRKKGLTAFGFHFERGVTDSIQLALLGRGSFDPPVDAVSRETFRLLDANGDGKLTRQELAAAPAVLLARDENEDEIITPAEIAPKAKNAPGSMFAGMMGGRAKAGPGNKTVTLLRNRGESPAGLVLSMQEQYGPRAKKANLKKLSRGDLGLDAPTFARLDRDRDGVLDANELAGFVDRAPDLELRVTLEGYESRVEVASNKGLAARVALKDGKGFLDLGRTRAELRSDANAESYDSLMELVRQQYLAQFRGADKDGNGALDEKEVKASPFFKRLVKVMDRNGDGKLTEKEVLAYLEHADALHKQVKKSTVTLVLSDQSRGLFDLMDANRDGRLSPREMRNAVGVLDERPDAKRRGYLTASDIPRSYRLLVQRGSSSGDDPNLKAFASIYGGAGYQAKKEKQPPGPLWFRKMDRNRDGDVSRKEFLFSDELFRKIDADGDGLISLQEAERYEAANPQR